ncbi:MAG: hypothetical protein LBQ83_02915, partial [Candidatus Margulisbacteria bacterium]|nr:hypothetical protein [Candidatus Margulisiibacteriota bacterium]
EAERKENASGIFMKNVDSGHTTLKDYQRQRYEQMMDGVPEYYEWIANNNLDTLEEQIKLLGYIPRYIHYPKTEIEKKEKTSAFFIMRVNNGDVILKDYQRQRYEKILDGVPEYQEWVTNNNLDALERQINLLGYRPRNIPHPNKTEEEKKENASGTFMMRVNCGDVTLKDYQRGRYEKMLDGVPEYQKYINEKNLCALESFILGHEHRPSSSVWASEEEIGLFRFYHSVKDNQVNLSASQQKRFDAIKDAPTMRQYYKKHGLTWRE